MRRYLLLCLVASFALAGCEGARNNSSWSGAEKDAKVVPALKTAESADSTALQTGAADSSQAKH